MLVACDLSFDNENITKSWAEIFVKLFKSFSPSGLSLPKLHSWVHRTSSSIKYFGSLNGQTAETYESLHKLSVKIPYRQDISTIVCDSLKNTQNKPNKINGHSKLIKPTLKFLLANIYDNINNEQLKSNETIDGLKNLIPCLDNSQ
nr:11893_t:CDS:2 [Entrophospora candida]